MPSIVSDAWKPCHLKIENLCKWEKNSTAFWSTYYQNFKHVCCYENSCITEINVPTYMCTLAVIPLTFLPSQCSRLNYELSADQNKIGSVIIICRHLVVINYCCRKIMQGALFYQYCSNNIICYLQSGI